MLLTTVLLLITPSIPIPPAESLAAAAALWAEHPPTIQEKEFALKVVVAEEASEALTRAGVGRGSVRGRKAEKRYANATAQLEARLMARVPQDRTAMDRELEACAADGVARVLTPAEIEQVRGFMATAVGRRFWDASAISLWPLRNCYSAVLRLAVTEEDYRAIGVRPLDFATRE